MEKEQLEKEVQVLLTHVSEIDKKYDDIVRITGERFNVFEILNLTTDETRTHSAFLAALLNPKGKHGLGSLILKLFLEHIDFTCFDADTAKVSIERCIGNITKEYEDGGRIDILIEDEKGHAIIIENKIYPGDQHKQLYRYFKYAKSNYKEGCWKLLYLNLYGNKPHESSTNKELVENKDYEIISYKDTITLWLEGCKIEATNYPILRETLTQYIYMIKKLTNQLINKKMEKEIASELIKSEVSIEAAFNISNSLNTAKKQLFENLKKGIIAWAVENSYQYEDKQWGKKDKPAKEDKQTFLYFTTKDLPEDVSIFFYFNFELSRFAIAVNLDKSREDYQELKGKVSERLLFIGKNENWDKYIFITFLQGKWANWESLSFQKEIISGNIEKELTSKINEITLQLKECFKPE